ncbi:MAG: hypothetical protein WAN11_25340 [Syntrophobacteraceae bacterium]
MKLRPVLIAGSVMAVVIAYDMLLLFLNYIISFYQEVLVSTGMTLTTQWLEVKPKKPMKTPSIRSELFGMGL